MFTKIRNLQNSFYSVCTSIKLSVNWMSSSKFHGIFTILILGLAALISPIALSYLAKTITTNSTGRILAAKTLITQVSEIRGVFLDEPTWGDPHNWTLIAETLAQYGINAVFVKDLTTFTRRPDNDIRAAIDAFHAKGIQYHSCIDVLQNTKPPGTSFGTEAITPNGEVYSVWSHCPIKAHDYVLAAIQNYLGNFSDIDGIMLDFIRYAETQQVCYCDDCRTAFDAWYYEHYGEHVSNWTLFYPNQQYVDIYNEWQTIPITQLVKDIHDLIKSINPNIVISEAAWTVFDDAPHYWRLYLGQDTACWIKEGYIDHVSPMIYTKDLEDLTGTINAVIKYWMGGVAEGSIPVVPILRMDWVSEDPTPEQFKAQIDTVRSKGLDGWIIWRYAGPGCPISPPDIRDYLEIIDMPSTFYIVNINVKTTANSATITWITTELANSRVEYGTNPLFGAEWKTRQGFGYWNITRNIQNVITNSANVTEHSITLNNLANGTYYFRVQSKGTSGTATSRVLTFTIRS